MLHTLAPDVTLTLLDTFDHLAERGATRFDKIRPGWEWLVDPDLIDLLNASTCPAGQLFGNYEHLPLLSTLPPATNDEDEIRWRLDADALAAPYGLVCWPEHAEPLRQAWIRAIERRRACSRPTRAKLADAA